MKKLKRLIIGTDTDCGKTHMTCQWIQALKQQGRRAIALKPIATGCLVQDNQLVSEDAEKHFQFSGEKVTPMPSWYFVPPVSIHIAAKQKPVVLEDVVAYCLSHHWNDYDDVLIESAGGLMSPLTDKATWIDFLILSKIPAVLVVGMKLGCLNHALLTASVLQMHNIACGGWIANCLDPHMLSLEENITFLEKTLPYPLIRRSDMIA